MNYSINKIAQLIEGTVLHLSDSNKIINHLLIDSRKVLYPETSLFFAINGERNDGHNYLMDVYEAGVRNFIVEEISADNFPADTNVLKVKNCLAALQQLVAEHRNNFNYPVIGITGSNGKTVIKEWLFQLLKDQFSIVRNPKSFNSQVGVPLSVWQMQQHHSLAMFEAGISLPNEMQNLANIIKPSIGLFTYLGSAHNEGFASIKEKIAEKLNLFAHADILIYCVDQPELHEEITAFKNKHQNLKLYTWSKNNALANINFNIEIVKNNANILFEGANISIPFTDEASIWNICSCFALIAAIKIKLNINIFKCLANVEHLQQVEMRLQLKEGINNCIVINDSYSTDLNSLQIALDFMQQQSATYQKTLIISDIYQSGLEDEKLYVELAQQVKQNQLSKVIAIGSRIGKYNFLFNKNTLFYPSTEEFIQSFHQTDFNNEIILIKGARHFKFEKVNQLLEKKVHQTVFEINLEHLVQNLNTYKSLLKPNVKLMAMVKAFSYGSGSFEIAKVLEYNKVDYLTVAYADEGVVLRKAGIKTSIMVMNPEVSSLNNIIKHNLEPEVYNFTILNSLIKETNGLEIGIHVEVDSGMKRLGFNSNELEQLALIIKQHPHIQIKSVFTHLAASDEVEHDDFTNEQINLFELTAKKFMVNFNYPILMHCLNSSGIARFKNGQFDMVRLGIGLYGIDPADVLQEQLLQIGTLKTVISQIRIIEPSESIGYGRKGKVNTTSKIAITAIGYADGLNRLLSNGNGYMLVNGQKAPIVGNICMDMTMIDVSEIDCKEGDEVIVFGEELSVVEIAKKLNTIPYEVLTSISQRVKRIYFYE